MPPIFTFAQATDITFGPGSLARLPEVISGFAERVLLISDPGVAAAGQ